MNEQTGPPPAPSAEELRASAMIEAAADVSMADPDDSSTPQSITVTAFKNGVRLT